MSDLAALLLSGSFLGGVGALVAVILAARSKARAADQGTEQKRDRSALGPLRDALDLKQRQIEAQAAHAERQQRAIERRDEQHRACREDLISQYGHLVRMRDFACRMAAALRRLGEDPGEPPPLPPDPAEHSRQQGEEEDDDFERRQLRQATDLLQSSSGIIDPPAPPPPTPAPPTRRRRQP